MKQLDIIADLLREGRTVKVLGRGNSMRPYLVHERDYIVLKGVTSADDTLKAKIVKGAVVLAEIAPKKYVLHRIINISADRITLLGDGNFTPEYCNTRDVLGIAVSFIRKGRDKEERADSWRYRLYTFCWTRTLFMRRYLLKLHDMLFHSCKELETLSPALPRRSALPLGSSK